MQVQELIKKTRAKEPLSVDELEFLVQGYVKEEIPDYQISAWLMAVYFQGLSTPEIAALTQLMRDSGELLPRKDDKSFWVDKHSTGGVGDKTSLILVPLVTAVCERLFGGGVKLPMISGRGLGHTGGTLDKLESVPGFSPRVSLDSALALLDKNHFFMMGQTAQLAPADKKIYALRDCTATVESIPLIVSSIISKKLSESLDGLVLDLKWGRGAFMKTQARAKELGGVLVSVAKASGVRAIGILTNMEEPLGWNVGNLLEVMECEDFINGKNRERGLLEESLALASAMVFLAGKDKITLHEAKAHCETELENPRVLELFKKMFEAQGGDFNAYQEKRNTLEARTKQFSFEAASDGYLSDVNSLAIGELVCRLGGGRQNVEDEIDPDVGIVFAKKVGALLSKGEKILTVYFRKEAQLADIEESLAKAVQISRSRVEPTQWVGESLL